MDEFSVDRTDLCTFRGTILHEGISAIETLRQVLHDAHVPADAYTLTEAGSVAHRGHTGNLHALDRLLHEMYALLSDSAQRVPSTTGNYRSAEYAATLRA